MAYIAKEKKQSLNKKSDLNHKFYNTSSWHNCRINYLFHNQLCEICKAKGVYKLAQEVHHIQPINSVDTLQEKFIIGLNVNNLQALCKDCHHAVHNEVRAITYKSNK